MYYELIEKGWFNSPIITVGSIDANGLLPSAIAQTISLMGRDCLSFLKRHPEFASSYRIELVPHKSDTISLRFDLHIDPLKWYDSCVKRDHNKKENTMHKARAYINDVRNNHREPVPNQRVADPDLSIMHCTTHANCFEKYRRAPSNLGHNRTSSGSEHGRTSSSTKHLCYGKYVPPAIFCTFNVKHKLIKDAKCNWSVARERIVTPQELGQPFWLPMKTTYKWISLSCDDHIRDLIVCPNPGYATNERHGDHHLTNEELLGSEEFWTWIFDSLINELQTYTEEDEYPVELFGLNFGKWETRLSKDAHLYDCHGHLHVHLTPDVVTQMESIYPAMQGKVNNPPYYGYENCMMLESKRLMSEEIAKLQGDITKVKEDIARIEGKVDNVQATIERKVDNLQNDMKKILKLLHTG